ncbi:prolyl-tRNA synthetase [Aureococcus anophagefferens]|uniref:proline--tRNA ligase n=1 Tax=Aureococcus anophagefferens TaxID=44056 RepID=A0ABR1FN99_AURAN
MAAAPDDVDERVLEGLDLAVVALPAADAPPAQMSRRCALGLIALSSFGFAVQSLVVKVATRGRFAPMEVVFFRGWLQALGCCGAGVPRPVARPPARWFGDTRTEVKWLCARGFVGFGGICFSFKAVSMIGLAESQVVGTVPSRRRARAPHRRRGLIVLVAMGIVVYAARRKAPAAAAKPVAEYAPVEDKDGVELAGTFAIADDDDDDDGDDAARTRATSRTTTGGAGLMGFLTVKNNKAALGHQAQAEKEGCMVIKPWGMAVWDRLRDELDGRIKASGAENAYFPLLIPGASSRRRRSTGGLEPDPAAELDEPLIIRPTSETMIWHMFGKWINSHRDLPLKINQWANVVRWEMRTRPFLRSSEFLWQEGHGPRDADEGFQNKDAKRELVWATSWGVSTRLLGALVMTHSDDAGLVLPPGVAPVQVAVVPITRKNDDAGTEAVDALVDGLVAECKALGVRVKVDERPNMRPGAKFFEWERKACRSASRSAPATRRRASSSSRAASAARSGPALGGGARLDGGTVDVGSYDELKAKIDADDLGFFRVYWAADDANEKAIKEDGPRRSALPARRARPRGEGVLLLGKPATHVALFARAF